MRCIKPVFAILLVLALFGCSSTPKNAHHSSTALEQYQSALRTMKAGKTDDAIARFVQMSLDYPSLAGSFANLGRLYQKKGMLEEAGEAFDKAVALKPQSVKIYNNAGIFYRSAGRFDDAEAAYLAAIEIAPDEAEPAVNLAILYDMYLNRPADAIQYYKRYLLLSGDKHEKVKLWLADLQRRTGAVANTSQ